MVGGAAVLLTATYAAFISASIECGGGSAGSGPSGSTVAAVDDADEEAETPEAAVLDGGLER